MENIKKLFFIFAVFSIIFLLSGIVSAINFANIERTRDLIVRNNPADFEFDITFNRTSYVPKIRITIVNPGLMDYRISRIAWQLFLVNGSKQYQGNDYIVFYVHKDVVIPAGGRKTIVIEDRNSTTQWRSYFLQNLWWIIENEGPDKVVWKNAVDIDGWVGGYDTMEYRYNVRSWYLWKLPEVAIHYEGETVGTD